MRVFGTKWGEVTGGWKKLHNEAFLNLCFWQHIRMIKSKMIRWTGHIALMGQ
jgi:hypothetical protein